MPATTRPLFEQIDTWLQEIDSTKTAAAKPAKNSKAGLKKTAISATLGETSHPSEDIDNNTQEAETGERFRENAEDVKKDVPGTSVDETDENSGGDQDDKQFHIGMNPKATGEDPSHETGSVKGDKEDERDGDMGGTSHPADAEDVGEKYSSMRLPALLKTAEDKAHAILADIANGIFPTAGATTKTAGVTARPAGVVAGYEVAAGLGLEKDAAEKVAAEFIEQAIRDADLDADLVGSYIHSYYTARTKQAEGAEDGHTEPDGDELPPEAAAMMAGGGGGGMPPEAGGGELPPEAGGEGGAGGLLGALGGGEAGGMPAEGAGGDMGGEGGGGDMGGGGGGGGGDQEKALQELAMALQELGISPEELASLAQGQGAKMASAVKSFQRSGKFRFQEAKTAAQARAREEIKDYIKELTGAR